LSTTQIIGYSRTNSSLHGIIYASPIDLAISTKYLLLIDSEVELLQQQQKQTLHRDTAFFKGGVVTWLVARSIYIAINIIAIARSIAIVL